MVTGRVLSALFLVLPLLGQEPVFRGGVAVVRVEVQVVDPMHSIGDLSRADFVVKDQDRAQPLRYFAREEQPLDVLLLLDVSVSMRPHVSRMVETAHSALAVLRPGDRVGIMVFDRRARLRSIFSPDFEQVRDALDLTLHEEDFSGGTDIHHGLFEAARFMREAARPEARRAVVILTDDQTEMARKDSLVLRGLWQADAILCALVVDSKFRNSRTESADVEKLAKKTGGESVRSEDAAGQLTNTLERIRQRYTLGFHVPPGVSPGSSRQIAVDLAPQARERYPKAQIHARRGYVVPEPVERVASGHRMRPAEQP